MSETSASPIEVYVAEGLTYPESVTEAIAAYETARQAWTTEYTALHTAENAVPAARAEDARTLTASVAAGTKDDAGGREVKARRAALVANERTAQAREKATAEADVLKAAIAAAGDELIPLIIAHARRKVDDYLAALKVAHSTVTSAAIAVQDASSALGMVSGVLRDQHGLSRPLFTAVATPSWPTSPCAGTTSKLDLIERAILEQTTAQRRSA